MSAARTRRPAPARAPAKRAGATRLALGADVGGTNTRLSLLDARGELVRADTLPSRGSPTFEAALATFLGPDRAAVAAASVAIAGPVVDGACRATNLPWVVSVAALERFLGPRSTGRVVLANDLVAYGRGALALPSRSFAHVAGPKRGAWGGSGRGGNVVVLSAGTGLGEALFVWDGARHVATGTEGAHADFAPRSALEWRLFEHLANAHGRVSVERAAAASSLGALFGFLATAGIVRGRAREQAAFARAEDPNAFVVERALSGEPSGECLLSSAALDLWLGILGAEAGNFALKGFALGGVLLGGSLLAKLARVVADPDGPFLRGFYDKGRMRPLLEAMPVAIAREPDAAVLHVRREAVALLGA